MALSFDHLMRSGGNRSATTATTERTSGPLSFDNLPKVTYASDDDGVRGKIARGMVSRIFSDENENRKVLEAAKAQRVNPTRILDNISQTRASQLPSDINYKALDPLNILNEEQSLIRFLSAKDKKPLAGRSFNNEAEGIFENFEESSIAAAVDRLRASYPDAGFDQKRPSQVIADARRRLYPELSPFDFAKQLGAVPRGAEGKPFVEGKGKPLSFASALKESLASGATSILSGGVQGYADLTGNQALSDEARTVTRQGKIAQQDAMEGRSGAGEIAVSLANSLPIMAATYATGGIAGSGVGLGTLAAGATAQKYGSNREEGYAPGRAFENAALTGLAEAAPEALPLGGFLKAAAPGIRATVGRIAKQAFEEGVSEGITTVGESVADSAALGKKIDANELLSNVGKSATVGAVMGAGLGTAAGFRDRIRQRVSTGDQATDEGAALAKEIFQQKLDLAAKEAPITKPTVPMQQEQAVADSNQDIDRYLVRQAQAAFDRTAGEELNALRSAEGRDDVQLGQERVSALATQVADDWGVSVDQLLDIKPAASSKPFKDIAQNLGTTPEDMLARSQSSQDVVPQPAQEADVVGAGPSQIHGQGLITQQPLGPSDGITLAQGANRTEAGQVVNHSNSPNTTVQIDTADAASPTAIAVPNRRIGAGEELTINYETEIPKIRQSLIDAPRETISLSNSKTLGNIDDQAQAVQSPDRVGNTEFGVGNDIAQNPVPRMGGIGRSGSLVQGGAQDQAIVDTANQQGPEVPLAASAAQPTQVAVDPLEQLRIENQRLRDEADSFRREARTQEITGLPNRRQFEFDSAGSAPGAVAAIDMDGLKALNDSVGHKAADAVLAKLGERLRSVETAGGKAYHLSGDEFAVAFQDPAAAQSVMAELQDALDNVEVVLDTPSGQYVYRGIGVSFGIGNDYATADESAKADKQRRLASGKREPARATGGGQVATPRRLVPIAAGGNVSDLARRDIQGPSNGQVGQVDIQTGVATQQTTQAPSASTNRVRMTRDQVRSEVAKNLGGNVASKLERQPWFNVVESVEDLPEAALKSLDDAQNTQGFVTPDGNVYIVSNNIDGNPTGVVLHEVGVHYGMRGVLGKDFAPILERFKSLRQSNNKVRAAYDSVPQDTQNANLDEEALAYYVEDNWGAKVPLMQRIVNAMKVFANRLGIPLSKLNASPELLVQIAKGATKKAADGRVRFNGGDTMRSASSNSEEQSSSDPSILKSKRRTVVEERVKAEARKQQVGAEMGVYDPKSATPPAMWDWSDNTIDKTIGLRGKLTELREQVQDRMLVFRDARDDIEGQIAALNEAADVYTLENLSSGKAGHRVDVLTNKYWNPLVEKMKKLNVSVSLLEDYAEAMHAEERNEAKARENPDMQDGGSGMTTAAARDFLSGKDKGFRSGELLSTAKAKDLAGLMDIIKKVTAETRKNLLESGVIDQGTYDALENKYKEYVPLRGKDGVENGAGRIGVGVNRVRNPIKRALGRGDGNRASNIIGEVFSDAQRSIIISEKAKVDQALLRMALQYPNSNVYEVEPVKVEQKYSEAAQEVYQGIKNIDNEPGTVIVPYKGRKYRVLLKDERMANAYNKLSAEQLNKIVSVLGVANRWFSAVLTRYNPAFIATNLVRDLGMGVPAIIAEHGLDAGVKLLKNYPKAMQAMVQQLRGKDPSNYHQKMAKEFSAEGGKTYFALADMPADAQGRMEYELQTVFGLISEGKPFRAVKKAFDKLKIAQAVESANEVIENTLRLSAYITLREKGISKQKAAQYAKDFTVNFSRRGQSTSALNAIWLFFNASVQGGHRTMKLIKDNPKMLVYLGSLAAMQGGLAWMAKGMEDDEGKNLWDQISSWEKQRNLIIPYFATVDGKKQARWFKVPVPYGFNLFSYMGGRVADLSNDMANDRDVDGKKFMGDMAAGISGAFSPLPLEAQGWRAVLPYYVNVGLALSTNKDDLGRRITQEQPYAKYEMPRTAYGRSDTPIVFKAISKGLNRLGGGDDFTKPTAPALLDWSPEDLQYLAEKFAGGLGSTAVKTVNMAESLIAGVPLSPREVPIASSFFSSSDARSSNASEYYDNRDKLERDIARIRTSVRNGKGRDVDTEALDPAALKIRVGKSGAVTITGGSLLSAYRKTERDIAKVKDEIAAVNSSDISSIAKKLRVLQLQNRRSELQERFNRQWRLLNRTR